MTKEQILQLENRLYKAMKESDLNVLDELLHDDLLFVLPSGETITKEMDLQTYKSENLKIVELNPVIENLNIIDDIAIITLNMEINGILDSESFKANFRYIRFWKEFQDGIKIIGGSGIAV